MKAVDLREKSSDDLVALKSSLTRDLFSYKMKNSVGQLEDTSLMGKVRKDVARIEQILNERSSASAGENAVSEVQDGQSAPTHKTRIRRLIGLVKNDKMQKTVVVEVVRYGTGPHVQEVREGS